jgi:APA family basic amino acid/polyamine antiporter
MPDAERPYRALISVFTGATLLSPVQSVSLLYTKTSTSGWGVVIMLIGIPVYYLTKAKE